MTKNSKRNIIFILFILFILTLSLRGMLGAPSISQLNTEGWMEKGPLEVSHERGYFAATYLLVEEGSFQFPVELAKFVIPDLGYHDGQYVSLFAPGVSFILIPAYFVGKLFSVTQVATYAFIAAFALANTLLVYAIARLLGIHPLAAWIAAFVFLFASPSYAYAVSLYQHHVSTIFILASIYALLKWHPFWSPLMVWFISAASISVDYPNLFLMLPIAAFTLGRVFQIRADAKNLRTKINLPGLLAMTAMLLPLTFFLWAHNSAYGSPFRLAGTVENVRRIDEYGQPLREQEEEIALSTSQKAKSGSQPLAYFQTRNLLHGLLIHTVSSDRGVLVFTPIVLFGILGATYLYQTNARITGLFAATIGINLVLYSLWGDPWGGWAFGSRYLIPSYALLAVCIGALLSKKRSHGKLMFIFFVVLTYSIAVNTLGALTTNRIPPKGEAIMLEQRYGRKEPYTYARNWEFLNREGSKSLVYQQLVKKLMDAKLYYFLITAAIVGVSGISLWQLASKKTVKEQ